LRALAPPTSPQTETCKTPSKIKYLKSIREERREVNKLICKYLKTIHFLPGTQAKKENTTSKAKKYQSTTKMMILRRTL